MNTYHFYGILVVCLSILTFSVSSYAQDGAGIILDCNDVEIFVDENCEGVFSFSKTIEIDSCEDKSYTADVFVDLWDDGTIDYVASPLFDNEPWRPVPGSHEPLPEGYDYSGVVYLKHIDTLKSGDELEIYLDNTWFEDSGYKHNVHLNISDACGSTKQCKFQVNQVDSIAPVVKRIKYLSIPNEEDMIFINLTDFEASDNCTPTEDLYLFLDDIKPIFDDKVVLVDGHYYTVNRSVPHYYDESGFVDFNGETPTLDGIPQAKPETIERYKMGEIYRWIPKRKVCEVLKEPLRGEEFTVNAMDAAGNIGAVSTIYSTLIICDFGSDISGSVRNINGDGLHNVSVKIDNSDIAEYPFFKKTDEDGEYAFNESPNGYTFKITGSLEMDAGSINLLDVIRYEQHIRGGDTQENGYPLIGYDINRDGRIDPADFGLLKQAVYEGQHVPLTTGWRFVEEKSYPEDFNYLEAQDTIVLELEGHDETSVNFIGVNVGDVTDGLAMDRGALIYDDQYVLKGDQFKVRFKMPAGGSMLGVQLDMSLKDLEYNGVATAFDNLTIDQNGKSVMIYGYNENATDVGRGETVLELIFKADKDGFIADKIVTGDVEDSFIVLDQDLRYMPVVMSQSGKKKVEKEIEFRIYPNPFAEQLMLTFEAEKGGDMEVFIYDNLGILLSRTAFNYSPGYTEVNLSCDMIENVEGIHLIKVIYNDQQYHRWVTRLVPD